MKYDLDLIRQILLDVEQLPPRKSLTEFKYPGYDIQTIDAHIDTLAEEKFIKVRTIKSAGGHVQFEIKGLTWKGQNFLDASNNTSVWQETKKWVKKEGLPITLTVLLEVMMKILKEMSGLP